MPVAFTPGAGSLVTTPAFHMERAWRVCWAQSAWLWMRRRHVHTMLNMGAVPRVQLGRQRPMLLNEHDDGDACAALVDGRGARATRLVTRPHHPGPKNIHERFLGHLRGRPADARRSGWLHEPGGRPLCGP